MKEVLSAVTNLFLFVPALASAVAVLAGRWRTVRLGAGPEARILKSHRVMIGAIVAFSALVGGAVYLGRSEGVKGSAALNGALLASTLGCCLPLLVYYGFGCWIRRRAVLAVVWLASLFLLYVCVIGVLLFVASLTNCPPTAHECPVYRMAAHELRRALVTVSEPALVRMGLLL